MKKRASRFTGSKDTRGEHPFTLFLASFVPNLARKSKQLSLAGWLLETTGTEDAAKLKAELDTEYRFMLSDPAVYQKLLIWDRDAGIVDPILKRQLNILIRTFAQNQIAPALLEEISRKEAELAMSYSNFRPEIEGKEVSENEIREILKSETDPLKRKQAWEASKKVGEALAAQILALVRLRNQAAEKLGYSDYFQMQLELQEVDPKWLLETLDLLGRESDAAYEKVVGEIETSLNERFGVKKEALGPFAWSDPFCQEDPLGEKDLDQMLESVDIPKAVDSFYQRMGVDVGPIFQRSDMFERPGKNQHAFCTHIDREGDVRTLNNVKQTLKWLETVLHEMGHAIYEVGFEDGLPWLLREPPHMITTEAMALIAGRQAYKKEPLTKLLGKDSPRLDEVDQSLRRRQLIFSRWVLVMTAFEAELYKNPDQDLNRLWWDLVEKYQKVKRPEGREGKADWAAKYHIGLAPVYYFSYLLGEMFASAIQESLVKIAGHPALDHPKAGAFLQEKLFSPGNRMPWNELISHVTGAPLTPDAWIREFGV